MGMGTGFAMNQARDLGPRMAYQVLPIKKADNNWKYGLLVPGIAPFVVPLAALFAWFLGQFLVQGYIVVRRMGNYSASSDKEPRCALRAAGVLSSAGALGSYATCRCFAALEQATQHINLNLDDWGLLLIGALGCCRHFGMDAG